MSDHGPRTRYWPEVFTHASHTYACDWHFEQYPFECSCGAKEKYRVVTDPMERCSNCGERHIEHRREGNLFPCETGGGVFE